VTRTLLERNTSLLGEGSTHISFRLSDEVVTLVSESAEPVLCFAAGYFTIKPFTGFILQAASIF